MKKSYFLGLAMLLGVTVEGYAQVNIGTFEELKKVGDTFANARDANSRLATANEALNAAKKELETANNELVVAKNDLTAAKSELSSANTALTTANNTLETAKANYNSVKRKHDAAKISLDKAGEKLKNLQDALKKAETEGVDVVKKCGLDERNKVQSFLTTGGNDNPLYFKFDAENLALVLSVKEKSGFEKILLNEVPTKWSQTTILSNTYDIGVAAIELYYEVPGFGEKSYSFSIAEVSNPTLLRSRLNTAIKNFQGVDETVKAVDPVAVAAAQEKVNAQQEIVDEKTLEFNNAVSDLTDAQGVVTKAQEVYDDANQNVVNATAAVTAADEKVTTAQEKVTAANGKITEQEGKIAEINASINAVNNYKNLSITADITVTDATFTLGDWGSDYEINGGSHKIVYPAGTANGSLVGSNKGYISNIGVVNGKIAATNNNSIKISFETIDKNSYKIYDAAGNESIAPISGELGYKVRNYFGVTINENGTCSDLEFKNADNIVYKAEWTKANTKTASTFYANIKDGKLSYNPAADKKNTFVYVQDMDIDADAFTNENNIVVDGICQNAVFVDDAAEGDDGWVYIPYAFNAKNLTYERTFGAKALATVCLPFETPSSYFEEMGLEKIMQFSDVDLKTNTYWFQYQDGSMNANEPYVLKFKNSGANIPNGGKIFQDLKNINVAATGDIDRYEIAPTRPGTGAEFLGVFVSTNSSMLARGGYKLYGFGDGVFRPMKISETVKCQAFRTYVKTPVSSSLAPEASFTIGELDEMGNVVNGGNTTGINTTVADANAFNVKGGNGAVIVTTGKAQKVSIYTVGGSLVKASNIEAGTVTIPVGSGVYIVNGKKVVVK